ncbi:MAG: hypothetical protein ACKVPJ_13615 [Chitinophagales bacterium]
MKNNSYNFIIIKPSLDSFMDECGPIVYLYMHTEINKYHIGNFFITVSSFALNGEVLVFRPSNILEFMESDFKEVSEKAFQLKDKIEQKLNIIFEVRPGIITNEIVPGESIKL